MLEKTDLNVIVLLLLYPKEIRGLLTQQLLNMPDRIAGTVKAKLERFNDRGKIGY